MGINQKITVSLLDKKRVLHSVNNISTIMTILRDYANSSDKPIYFDNFMIAYNIVYNYFIYGKYVSENA